MGRTAEGYRLRQQAPGSPYSVRFRVDGKRFEVFLGTRDRSEAERRAREAYAAALQGRDPRGGAEPRRASLSAEVVSRWLRDAPLRATTAETYRKYALIWLTDLRGLDDASLAAYVRQRLRQVRARTLRSELSALRQLLTWMVETGEIAEAPLVPGVDTSKLGTPAKGRRYRTAAPDYTEREIRKLLSLLPERSPKGMLVRARCTVLYETGLRTTTVDALSVPEHYSQGATSLRITDDIDKEGFARTVPLSAEAQRVLRRVAPRAGVIFGAHRYSDHTGEAARRALPAAKAAVFTPQHLRSARATHLLEGGAELPGVQFLLGHRNIATTSKYVRATEAAARRALGRVSGRTGKK